MTIIRQMMMPVIFALALFGCAVTPQQPGESVAASYEAIILMTNAVADARDAGLLDAADVAKAKRYLQTALDATNAASDALGQRGEDPGHLGNARAALALVSGILEAVK